MLLEEKGRIMCLKFEMRKQYNVSVITLLSLNNVGFVHSTCFSDEIKNQYPKG